MKTLFIALLAMAAMTANAQDYGRYNNDRNAGTINVGRHNDTYDVGRRNDTYGIDANRHNYDNRPIVPPLSKEEAKMVLQMVKNQSFDDNKFEVAKVCVTLRPMFAEDIKAIAKTFSFDSGRLKFLKYAYPYCVDKENAMTFNSTFTFKSDADELYRFILDYNNKHKGTRR